MTVNCWEHLTREEVVERAPRALAILPVAAVEQHGPHLATRTDTAIVEAVLFRALKLLPAEVETLVTPTVWCGASDHHLPFGGTLSLSTDTLRRVLSDLVGSVVAAGCRGILLLNGHGGNALTCALVATEASADHHVLVAAANYWDLLDDDDPRIPGHAGCFETSLMLEIAPDMVRSGSMHRSPETQGDRLPGVYLADPDEWRRRDGFTDDPGMASAAVGAELLDRLARRVAETISELDSRVPRT